MIPFFAVNYNHFPSTILLCDRFVRMYLEILAIYLEKWKFRHFFANESYVLQMEDVLYSNVWACKVLAALLAQNSLANKHRRFNELLLGFNQGKC